jgi:translation initiation factor IF-3
VNALAPELCELWRLMPQALAKDAPRLYVERAVAASGRAICRVFYGFVADPAVRDGAGKCTVQPCCACPAALNPSKSALRSQHRRLPIRRPNRAPAVAAKDGPRINDEIRNLQVQLIDASGTNVGVVETAAAVKMAIEAGMDLVEISPNNDPPVCKIMDYGKYKFQAQKKASEARKKQKIVEIKEIKLRPMIDDHDYDVKMRAMLRFFEEGDKVKITLRYRGREMAHQEIGTKLLDKVKAAVADVAKVEQDARFEGRQVVMVLAPR